MILGWTLLALRGASRGAMGDEFWALK